MKTNEMEALKSLVASFVEEENGDLDIGGCSVGACSTCCQMYNGRNG